jgi:hypothetical protein
MGLEKINLDIEMDFTNFHFHFKSFFFKDFFLLDFFILSDMVFQCVALKIYKFSFQLHWKKNIHNDSFFGVVWIVTLDVPSFVKSTLD